MSLELAPKVACARNRAAALGSAESSLQEGGAGGGVKLSDPLAKVKCPLISPFGNAVLSMTTAALPSAMISRISLTCNGPVALIFQRYVPSGCAFVAEISKISSPGLLR